MKKIQAFMNRPVYLDLSILKMRKMFLVSIKKPAYCQLLTSFLRSNRMLVNVFIDVLFDVTDELDVFCRPFSIQTLKVLCILF